MRTPGKLFLASSNPAKLREYLKLAGDGKNSASPDLELLTGFDSFPPFEENAPTFGENALGKTLHYSRLREGLLFADDSGLVVPALGGAPGVHSARYAGVNSTNAERIAKLLSEMRDVPATKRAAYFVCAIAVAYRGRPVAVITDRVEGEILEVPRGHEGFGYDPVFYFPPLGKSFSELTPEEKNVYSHRGKAFRRLLSSFSGML